MMNTYHIPEEPHDPPVSYNPLFDTFKQEFGNSISSNRMIYLEISRVFMIIKSYKQLHEWVVNQQKTQSMIQIFENKEPPKIIQFKLSKIKIHPNKLDFKQSKGPFQILKSTNHRIKE